MGIEACRDQQQLGAEVVDRRQHLVGPDVAEAEATTARWQQDVHQVAGAAVTAQAGLGEQAGLVGAVVGHPGVVLEDVLGAVAVVDIEIDHRDPFQTVAVAGVGGGDGDVVEQAEAHRGTAGGMVAGRAHRAEGQRILTQHHRIDGGDTCAGGMHRGTGRARRGPGVHVQLAQRRGLRLQHQIQQRAVVDPGQFTELGWRRFAPLQLAGEGLMQRVEHHLQALRAFRMARAGIVQQAGGMGEDQHGGSALAMLWLPQRFAVAIGPCQHPGQHEQQV
ncbi:hypothetical protein D3C71_871200 [compost metagenome]